MLGSKDGSYVAGAYARMGNSYNPLSKSSRLEYVNQFVFNPLLRAKSRGTRNVPTEEMILNSEAPVAIRTSDRILIFP